MAVGHKRFRAPSAFQQFVSQLRRERERERERCVNERYVCNRERERENRSIAENVNQLLKRNLRFSSSIFFTVPKKCHLPSTEVVL